MRWQRRSQSQETAAIIKTETARETMVMIHFAIAAGVQMRIATMTEKTTRKKNMIKGIMPML